MSQRIPHKPCSEFLAIITCCPVHCHTRDCCFTSGLPWVGEGISVKTGWNTEHTGCRREVSSSVISFSLQSKLKCTNSWCTPAPGFRAYLLHMFSSEDFHFSIFTATFRYFLNQFGFHAFDVIHGIYKLLKILCLPEKKEKRGWRGKG